LVVLAAGWVLGIVGVVLKGAADTAELGAASVWICWERNA